MKAIPINNLSIFPDPLAAQLFTILGIMIIVIGFVIGLITLYEYKNKIVTK
jgi:hypothetical protein